MNFTPEQLRSLILAYVRAWSAHEGSPESKRMAALTAAAQAVNVPLHVISRMEVTA